ncbi:MAG: histidine--tRNA ligase [Elusimicrobia bacterium]|nr:histidine--tRNA ligase [Elusimicrobiota bacterium]
MNDLSSNQSVRGMHDIAGGRMEQLVRMESFARDIFSLYAYQEIRTPHLESLALFERALGQTTDIVEKEMFVLKDRGERLLVLRPEGTAGIVRSYIENDLDKKSVIAKFFYMGSMYRAERPQAGRLREFNQIGSEYFGNSAPSADAETIELACKLLETIGVQNVQVQLNSIGCVECRPNYHKALLDFLMKFKDQLCSDCVKRMNRNPLRALDCKIDKDKLEAAPNSLDYLCFACKDHHLQLEGFLKVIRLEYRSVPHLVRGLDYYNRTVFEIYSPGKDGSQDALAAGGRYDTLTQQLGGALVPAVGFAMGVERVLNLLEQTKASQSETKKREGLFLIALGKEAFAKSFQTLNFLRSKGFKTNSLLNLQSLKSQMRLADGLGARFCLIIGEDEIKNDQVTLKDLEQKSQTSIPSSMLLQELAKIQ